MDHFEKQFSAFLSDFGTGKTMVLSTSLQDKVTSRMMSIVQMNGLFYFQTDRTSRKYDQLIGNKQVALCIENIQIEGICNVLGHPLDDHAFCTLYKEHFSSAFEKYSALSNEILFAVTPSYIERWVYKDGIPFVEMFDMETKVYHLHEYKGI